MPGIEHHTAVPHQTCFRLGPTTGINAWRRPNCGIRISIEQITPAEDLGEPTVSVDAGNPQGPGALVDHVESADPG